MSQSRVGWVSAMHGSEWRLMHRGPAAGSVAVQTSLRGLAPPYNIAMWRDPSLHPLSHQHQHGLALSVLIDRGLKADSSEKVADGLADKVAATWEVELQSHFRVEEEVLFPAVEPFLESKAIVADLIGQHREMEELIGRIAAASGAARVELLTEFGQLLSRHIRTEERQLFEEIQARLSQEQMASLGQRIDETVQRICPATGKLPWEAAREG
jgi:hemerythrin-like domain-containing protein